MTRVAGYLLMLALLVLALLNARWVAVNWDAVRVVTTPAGSAAPDFTVELLDGKRLRLAELRGRPVVLVFFATWCGPCKMEMPGLERLYRDKQTEASFLAVDTEGAEARSAVDAFRHAFGLTFPIAVAGAPVADLYKVDSIPHTVILDGEGKVREVLSGVHRESDVVEAIDNAKKPRSP